MRVEPKHEADVREELEELIGAPRESEARVTPEQETQDKPVEFADATPAASQQQYPPPWHPQAEQQAVAPTVKSWHGIGIFVMAFALVAFLFTGIYFTVQSITEPSGEIVTTNTYSPDDAPWVDMDISFDGERYQLGETTLQDLLDDGFVIDDEVSSYTVDSTVGKYSEEYNFSLIAPGDEYSDVSIGVLNPTSETAKIVDCVVYAFNYEDYDNEHVMSIGGIATGDSIDKVKELFGEPYEIYTSGTSKYTSWTYQTTKGKHVRLTFYDGEKLSRIVASIK